MTGKTGFALALALLASVLPANFNASNSANASPTRRFFQRNSDGAAQGNLFNRNTQKKRLGGLDLAIWQPVQQDRPMPLVIFSHGFRGFNTQTIFLMKDLADAGYLVIAPNHSDALKNGISKPEVRFSKIGDWSENTYRDREKDIRKLLEALHADAEWNSKIDWSKIALSGHSLGGYTVLGLAGAWPSWKLPGVKAVIALAPYCNPFMRQKTLSGISVPVMYQSGTRDIWIDSFIKGKNGAYSQTPSPAIFVEFDAASHFAWSNLNGRKQQRNLISHYCIEFLNKYVLENPDARPDNKLDGIRLLETK